MRHRVRVRLGDMAWLKHLHAKGEGHLHQEPSQDNESGCCPSGGHSGVLSLQNCCQAWNLNMMGVVASDPGNPWGA